MDSDELNDPIEVFSGTTWQAGMVASLLENSEITSFMKDVIMGTLNPWWTDPGGVGAVKVFVAKRDLGRAIEIVKEYDMSQK